MMSPIFLFFLFVSVVVSASATSEPCMSQAIKPPSSFVPGRNSHFSRPSLRLSLDEVIKSRQAVAPGPVLYETQRRNAGVAKSLNKLKKLGWELTGARDDMGRLSSRMHKLGKRATSAHARDGAGQEIHDLLHHLLGYFQSSPGSISTRDVFDEGTFVVKPRQNFAVAAPSASPVPSGRAKRSPVMSTAAPFSTADLEQTVAAVLETFSSTLTLATGSVSTLSSSSQRTSIKALVDELRCKWRLAHDVPELLLGNDIYY
ncbi:hypothetical protein JCM11491_006207 [Sporobolomyces phaffii]